MVELVRDQRDALLRVNGIEERHSDGEHATAPQPGHRPVRVVLVVDDDHLWRGRAERAGDVVDQRVQLRRALTGPTRRSVRGPSAGAWAMRHRA
jgi:hypothetical protein